MSSACHSRHEVASDASSKPRSRGSTHFSNAFAGGEPQVRTCESPTAVTTAIGQPVRPSGRTSEEAATPRYPERAMTQFRNLQQFTLENRAVTAAWQQARTSVRHRTHALAVICLNRSPPAIEIWVPFVQKLWRTRILCGKFRKSQKKPGPGICTDQRGLNARLRYVRPNSNVAASLLRTARSDSLAGCNTSNPFWGTFK